jgi:hypothetical protein
VPQLPEGKQFRFVFCSGKFAEWDQNKSLHFLADTRHVKVPSIHPSPPLQAPPLSSPFCLVHGL